MAQVRFTEKQTQHCLAILSEFCKVADARRSLPSWWHIRLTLLRDMIRDDVRFDQFDYEWLEVWLGFYLAILDEDDVDPLAEQAFAKCAGYWFIIPPYYDRIRTLSRDKQLPPIGT